MGVVDVDAASVRLGDGVADGQAESNPLSRTVSRRVESGEAVTDRFTVQTRDPGSVVGGRQREDVFTFGEFGCELRASF